MEVVLLVLVVEEVKEVMEVVKVVMEAEVTPQGRVVVVVVVSSGGAAGVQSGDHEVGIWLEVEQLADWLAAPLPGNQQSLHLQTNHS